MGAPTLAERLAAKRGKAGNTPRPTTAGTRETVTHRASRVEPDVYSVDDYDNTGVGAFAHGVADTVTFGFLDEAGAWVDSSLPEWAGGNGKSYEDNLRRNRAILGNYEEEHTGAYISGQVAGAFVPVAGVGGRAQNAYKAWKSGKKAQVGYMAMAGAAQGAAYGYGSADAEDIFSTDRLGNAARMGVFGAGAGFFMGTAIYQGGRVIQAGYQRAVGISAGKSIKLPKMKYAPIGSRSNPADDVVEDLGDLRRTKARKDPLKGEPDTSSLRQRVNAITGKNADELEEGALLTGEDLLDGSKREMLFEALAKLSPSQAKVAAGKLTKAMESGDLTKEPHFRSILGLDLSEFGDEEVLIPQVADILTEMGEDLLNKAGMGRRTTRSMEQELRARYAGGNITEGQIDDLVNKVKETRGSANTGKLIMTLAGVKFARETKRLMPDVMKGDKEAREALADQLTTALRVSAKGQFLLSEAGRNLGMLNHSKSLLIENVEEGILHGRDEVAKRVAASFKALDDEGLNELLAQTRDLSNLEEISQVLMDPRRAQQVGTWMRFRNTFEAFIKSNTLTPATAVINLVGVPIHNWVRNGGARHLAEITARAQGNIPEATILQMSREAAKAVRWGAHLEGMKAAARRVKWEALGSFKSITGVAGATKAAKLAGASRQAMIARGFKPPPIREFDLKKRLAVTDVDAFNKRLADRAASDAPFASLVNTMERVGATALNTLDAVGTATAKVASGVIDDYGRALVMTKEVYAEMAGKATAQAIREGVPEDKLGDYVAKQTKKWATLPPEDILEMVERKLIDGNDLDDVERMLLRRDYDAEKEAERVLFLDGAQTEAGKAFATVARKADSVAGLGQLKGILMPYIDTPTRIIERGAASYTPWGHLTKESQEALARGGVEAAMERARMEVGGTIIGAGMLAAATGAATITNGADYRNSAGLGGAPANRLNLPGGAFVEFGRLEPLAMGFALGGVIGQMWKASAEAGDKYGQDDAIAEAFAIAYGGFRDALLEKSYLTGLSDLFEAFSSNDEGALSSYFTKLYPDAAARTLPLSGTFRQLNETISGKSMEAAGALDRIAKVTPGMGAYLPSRIDALGNEIEGRTMGIAAGITSDDDAVTAKLRSLGVDITNLRKADPVGFDLTSEELSELRMIRAREAVNKEGMTMKEALAALFSDPQFNALPDKAMVEDAVVETMSGFNQSAREIYESRNQQYLSDREAARSFKAYIADGITRSTAKAAAGQDVQAMGLPDASRLNEL